MGSLQSNLAEHGRWSLCLSACRRTFVNEVPSVRGRPCSCASCVGSSKLSVDAILQQMHVRTPCFGFGIERRVANVSLILRRAAMLKNSETLSTWELRSMAL